MQTVSNILQGNPFSTPVGQLVERATDGAQSGEDWALLMAVCDAVNELEEGPRDALRALRRRLTTSAGRSNSAVQYSLSVLETCVKNCGFRFHLLVAKRDFLDELVRLISPKNEPPQQIQDRVLGLLQAWSDAFRGRPELREVERLVEELRSKGVEFPMTDLDSMAPINTPARSAASAAAASTNHDSIADLSLLQELNRTNRQMQQRIVELVDVIANDEVVGELLRINDDLNNGFLRFDRFERYREANRQPQVQQQQQQPSFNPMFNRPDALQQPPPVPASSQPPEPQAAPLIDFSTPDEPKPSSIGQQLAGLQITQAGSQSVQQQQPLEQSDEFDMFASSRQAFDRNRAGMSGAAAYAGATDGGQQLATGLQNGLAQRTGIATAGGAASQTATSGVSSSDFNLFLQQQQQQNYTSAGTAASSSDRSRTLKHRDDQPEDTLFAL
uniref:VHS domain-containing protein n=1 Tax=Macrostomum lignano TaxID=282301 RepID=A0A1I8HT97_9PLAT